VGRAAGRCQDRQEWLEDDDGVVPDDLEPSPEDWLEEEEEEAEEEEVPAEYVRLACVLVCAFSR